MKLTEYLDPEGWVQPVEITEIAGKTITGAAHGCNKIGYPVVLIQFDDGSILEVKEGGQTGELNVVFNPYSTEKSIFDAPSHYLSKKIS